MYIGGEGFAGTLGGLIPHGASCPVHRRRENIFRLKCQQNPPVNVITTKVPSSKCDNHKGAPHFSQHLLEGRVATFG